MLRKSKIMQGRWSRGGIIFISVRNAALFFYVESSLIWFCVISQQEMIISCVGVRDVFWFACHSINGRWVCVCVWRCVRVRPWECICGPILINITCTCSFFVVVCSREGVGCGYLLLTAVCCPVTLTFSFFSVQKLMWRCLCAMQ